MRWDNLLEEEQQQLTGYRDPAVVRRFDAPEALDIRFYEVRTKSALNRVPAASRVPFRWTVNPYRGCTHACAYCMRGETPILMADGRTRPIRDVRPGDRIYGTERRGAYRRFVQTVVLDQWSSVKPAYRVTLEDGTELVTSGDHRFLTRLGWKHVTGAMAGPLRRPYLTANNELMGTGAFAAQPDHCADYKRGYLAGLIRGDGTLGIYAYERGGRTSVSHRFRLAVVDLDALRRARDYLLDAEVRTSERLFQLAVGNSREVRAICAGSRVKYDRIRELIEWPATPSSAWSKGYLAGIFDAEGTRSRGILRIANCGPEILLWTEQCLRRFGFDVAVERTSRGNGMTYLRVRGGLAEQLRFLHTTDPAITRKRSIDGVAIENEARLRVASIEPLGRAMRLYDVTTGTGDFIANGVVSHNCFARPTHTYLDFDTRRDFEREIVVKVNVPEVLRAELARPKWTHEHVALGTNTDPYQWVEGRYKLMPGIWEALRDSRTPCSVLTKSPLVLRDLSLLQDVARHTNVSAALSVPTLDEKAWRATEPHTPHPRARLEAVAELNRAGIPTGILAAPLMPGINDAPEQVERIIELAEEAGATSISGIALHLRGEVRDIFFDWLRAKRPDLLPRYEQLYRRGAYAPPAERERLAALVRDRSSPPQSAPPGRWRARPSANHGPASRARDTTDDPPTNVQRRLF